jgi:putative oxidoreductase
LPPSRRLDEREETIVKYSVLAGRQLFSIIFIIASAGHFSPQTIESAARHGVPLPGLLVPVSGVIALMGGLSVLVGFKARVGAWLLVFFLIPVTLVMHNFWAAPDVATFQLEQAMFMKNLTMLGGALLISYFGAGPLSLDAVVDREPIGAPRIDLQSDGYGAPRGAFGRRD